MKLPVKDKSASVGTFGLHIAGGDIYIKRALNATLDMAGSDDFDLQTLPGYLAMRQGCVQSSRLTVV